MCIELTFESHTCPISSGHNDNIKLRMKGKDRYTTAFACILKVVHFTGIIIKCMHSRKTGGLLVSMQFHL